MTIYHFGKVGFRRSPHRNPDNEEIESPNIHVFKEEFSDKWVMAIPPDRFYRSMTRGKL